MSTHVLEHRSAVLVEAMSMAWRSIVRMRVREYVCVCEHTHINNASVNTLVCINNIMHANVFSFCTHKHTHTCNICRRDVCVFLCVVAVSVLCSGGAKYYRRMRACEFIVHIITDDISANATDAIIFIAALILIQLCDIN